MISGGKGNIMNRPVKKSIRDKNQSLQLFEEEKQSLQVQFKQVKLNEITERRYKANMGNKSERKEISSAFKNEAMIFDQKRQEVKAHSRKFDSMQISAMKMHQAEYHRTLDDRANSQRD